MKVQELIDKIQEIKSQAQFGIRASEKESEVEDVFKTITRICDNILIDWKMENARCLSLMNSNEKH